MGSILQRPKAVGQGRRSLLAPLVAVLALSMACGAAETPTQAIGATTVVSTTTSTSTSSTSVPATTTTEVPLRAGFGVVSPPEWWPLRGPNLVGCARRGGGGVCSGRHHRVWAIDIEGPEGQPVYASGAGFATVKDDSTGCGGYGRAIMVDHGGGVTSLYAHLAEFSLDFSDGGVWVGPDTQIGTMGHTGSVSGCSYTHLHYEESTSGSHHEGATDPGPMVACVGDAVVVYPDVWGRDSWSGLPGHSLVAVNDGPGC